MNAADADLQGQLRVIRRCLQGDGEVGAGLAFDDPVVTGELARVVRACGLSAFERDVLVLVAGCELDAGIAALCARAQGDVNRAYATFGLALAALPGAHWDAVSPDGPLRALALIDVERHRGSLAGARLGIDERVLLALLGLDVVDAALAEVASAEPAAAHAVVSSQKQVLERLSDRWRAAEAGPVVLRGGSVDDRQAFERALTAAVDAPRLWRIEATALPTDPGEQADTRRRLARETRLTGAPIVVELDNADPPQLVAIGRWSRRLASSAGRVVFSGAEAVARLPADAVVIDLPEATLDERVGLWRGALGPRADLLNGHVERLAGQFRLSAEQIRAAAGNLDPRSADVAANAHLLWQDCRRRSRAAVDGLADRIVPTARWADLVLPDREVAALRDLLRHARHRTRVFEEWQVTGSARRGAGVTALLSGPSGTGKSLAAEVVAAELEVDLYRIDLSQVVSKYIGETEKNLRRVFDAAERGGAVLVIDEADALFGHRSEVKDSHDRYANIEVSYLLQRMESYCGLAILTTNLRANIDDAFLRRLGFVITFPFPDVDGRAALWERAFGSRTPIDDLRIPLLAQLNLTGGSIRNVAVHAAFRAAERGGGVTMADILAGARTEYGKLDRPLTPTELAGWPQ